MTMTTPNPTMTRTPARLEAPGGAYISDPKNATMVMGGSEWDGAPQIPGATLVLHAMGDRTKDQLTFAEVTFPAGQRPWFHAHHREDEGFFVVEGQLTVTVLDEKASVTRRIGLSNGRIPRIRC